MEELVKELAELQAEMQLIADKIAGDKLIQEHVTAITELQKQASEGRDALHDLISAYGQDEIYERIEDIKAQIIDASRQVRTMERTQATTLVASALKAGKDNPNVAYGNKLEKVSVNLPVTGLVLEMTDGSKFMMVVDAL